MMYPRHELGRWGEEYAAKLLTDRGFFICARNWRCQYGEIDIVCSKGSRLYAFEVKTRTVVLFGYPEEAITPRKLVRMRLCAQAYGATSGSTKRRRWARIGLVSIYCGASKIIVRLYTDI